MYIKNLSSLPPTATPFTDRLASFLPLLPNLKGLVLYGASPPPELCYALSLLPKLEDLEFFMFTDWRLPSELVHVEGLKEIDINPDRFLSESDEEDDGADEEDEEDEWKTKGVWKKSKETMKQWVWANRETVRKVTIYDQSEGCLPLRYVSRFRSPSDFGPLADSWTTLLQILQPKPDTPAPTFPVLSTLSLASTPHITHSALSLSLSPPQNPKGPQDPLVPPVVAEEWFLDLLPHVPLLETLTLSYNLTDAPSPYDPTSDGGSVFSVGGEDDVDVEISGRKSSPSSGARNHRQRTDYSLVPYYLNSLTTPNLSALRKLDLRLLSISPASATTKHCTTFPSTSGVHPITTAVSALRHLETLEELSITVGKLEVDFLSAIALALKDVVGFRSLGIEVCAGAWGGGEGEDVEEGDGIYWGLRDGLLWGNSVVRRISVLQFCVRVFTDVMPPGFPFPSANVCSGAVPSQTFAIPPNVRLSLNVHPDDPFPVPAPRSLHPNLPRIRHPPSRPARTRVFFAHGRPLWTVSPGVGEGAVGDWRTEGGWG